MTSHTTPTHHHTPSHEPKAKTGSDIEPNTSFVPLHDVPVLPASSDTKSPDLRELLEKNIKWSQVIYHQNRKIQRRLTWMTIGSYLRLFLILLPLIVGVFFISDFLSRNSEFVNGALEHWQNYLEIFQSQK